MQWMYVLQAKRCWIEGEVLLAVPAMNKRRNLWLHRGLKTQGELVQCRFRLASTGNQLKRYWVEGGVLELTSSCSKTTAVDLEEGC